MSEYRSTPRSCPSCGATMTESATDEALLDTCPACGGLWVDWQDGELRSVAQRVAARRVAGAPPGEGSGQCPVCAVPLRADSAGADALAIARCTECAGAFVPVETLSRLREQEGLPKDAPKQDDAPMLTRMLDTIARWLLPG